MGFLTHYTVDIISAGLKESLPGTLRIAVGRYFNIRWIHDAKTASKLCKNLQQVCKKQLWTKIFLEIEPEFPFICTFCMKQSLQIFIFLCSFFLISSFHPENLILRFHIFLKNDQVLLLKKKFFFFLSGHLMNR